MEINELIYDELKRLREEGAEARTEQAEAIAQLRKENLESLIDIKADFNEQFKELKNELTSIAGRVTSLESLKQQLVGVCIFVGFGINLVCNFFRNKLF